MKLGNAAFSECKIEGLHLTEADLTGCTFSECGLVGVTIAGSGASMVWCETDLTDCDLSGMDLRDAIFVNCDLRGTSFVDATEANLAGADFQRAFNVPLAKFSQDQLAQATLDPSDRYRLDERINRMFGADMAKDVLDERL
jgi:uncharacterized protein YjbI with pentapeptide repeats